MLKHLSSQRFLWLLAESSVGDGCTVGVFEGSGVGDGGIGDDVEVGGIDVGVAVSVATGPVVSVGNGVLVGSGVALG